MASNLNALIEDVVAGDDFEVRNTTITDIPAGQTLVLAWLTIKERAGDPDPGVVQKVITPIDVPGTGHIIDTGADGIGGVRFDLTPSDTAALINAEGYVFDIKVKTSAGKFHRPVLGKIITKQGVTKATTA